VPQVIEEGKQIRPAITEGAEVMDRLFPGPRETAADG
jgi:hypothetical protein